MRWKKGNRWKGSKGQVRYMTWRKMVFELNKAKSGGSMYGDVRSVIKNERQHEFSMHITSRVGISFPKIDTIDITE